MPHFVAWLFGKFFYAVSNVRPVHYWKYPYMIAYIQVDCNGTKDDVWMYIIRRDKFVVWTIFLKLFFRFNMKFFSPFSWLWMGRFQIPDWWSLHYFRIHIPFLFLLTFCSSHIYSHPASYNLTIDRRELCDIPGSKCAPPDLSGKWGNASAHAMFDDILLPDAGEIKIVWPRLCAFSWGSSDLVYVPDAPVSASLYFIVLSILWGWPILLK